MSEFTLTTLPRDCRKYLLQHCDDVVLLPLKHVNKDWHDLINANSELTNESLICCVLYCSNNIECKTLYFWVYNTWKAKPKGIYNHKLGPSIKCRFSPPAFLYHVMIKNDWYKDINNLVIPTSLYRMLLDGYVQDECVLNLNILLTIQIVDGIKFELMNEAFNLLLRKIFDVELAKKILEHYKCYIDNETTMKLISHKKVHLLSRLIKY